MTSGDWLAKLIADKLGPLPNAVGGGADVAQTEERLIRNQQVGGSTPPTGSKSAQDAILARQEEPENEKTGYDSHPDGWTEKSGAFTPGGLAGETEQHPDISAEWSADTGQGVLDAPAGRTESRLGEGVHRSAAGAGETTFPGGGGNQDLAPVRNRNAPSGEPEASRRTENGTDGTRRSSDVSRITSASQPRQSTARPVSPSGPRTPEDILRRVPPQNIEAEQSFLGAILLEPERLKDTLVSTEDFYRDSHREIYAAMARLDADAIPIDAITLSHELRVRGQLEATGGIGYIAELAACVPTALNISHYAAIIRECAFKRQLATRSTELATLAYDGLNSRELVDRWQALVPQTDAGRELPVLLTPKVEVLSGQEFFDRHQAAGPRHWLVEGMLARKEISLWSGKVEHGKTTAMRTLVICVARGEMFLERHTYPSKVLYVMLDADGEDVTFEEFQRLGWDAERDAIDFLIDPVMCLRPNSFEQFHAELLKRRPQFVLIDPLGRFEKVSDNDGSGGFNGYGMTYAMARFSELAKRTDCHIALLHHIPRGRLDVDDVATAGFGSVSIAGGCNARFRFLKKPGGIYTFASSQGKGAGFIPFDGEQVLERDPDTHWVSLRGPYNWSDQAQAVKPLVLEAVNHSDEPMSAFDLGRALGVQRSIAGSAAKMLFQDGLIDMEVAKSNKRLFSRKAEQGRFL